MPPRSDGAFPGRAWRKVPLSDDSRLCLAVESEEPAAADPDLDESDQASLATSQPNSSPPADRRARIQALIDRLNKANPYWPEMDALKDLITQEDLPLLHRQLAVGQPHSRRAAAWILAHIWSPESIDPLRKTLNTDRGGVMRWEAAHTLGFIRAQAAQPDLIHAMESDADGYVRARAAEALNLLGTPEALAAIRKAAATEKTKFVSDELKFLVDNPGYRVHRMAALQPGQVTEGYCHGTRYLIYTPKNMPPRAKRRWLILVHGTMAYPEPYINRVKADADRYQLMVLAPHFDYGQYSWFGTLNLRRGKIRPDLRVLEIVENLSQGSLLEKRMLLFGHSEGGAFVYRFTLAHPDRVDRSAAGGSALTIDFDPGVRFPAGLAPSPLAADLGQPDFSRLAQARFAVVFGGKEPEPRQKVVAAFMETVRQYARQKGLACNVVFLPVPQGGHSPSTNWARAREFLFAQMVPER